MPHYCRICGRHRPGEKFNRKGWMTLVCKDCQRLPQAERERIERLDELRAMFRQRNISEKNLARLRDLAQSPSPDVAGLAQAILEAALIHPRKRKRMSVLRRARPDLIGVLAKHGVEGCGAVWGTEPFDPAWAEAAWACDWDDVPEGPRAPPPAVDSEDDGSGEIPF